jgi:hypothetical protein
MTPDAELPPAVYGKGRRVFRVVERRSVAVFAHYIGVGRLTEVVILIPVAIFTVSDCPVLDLDSLPVRLIPLAMPAVHVAPFPDAEILRHQENLADKQQGDDAEYDNEWSPDMTPQVIPPLFEKASRYFIV